MNTENTRSLEGYQRHRNPDITFSVMRDNYRKRWLQVRSNYPDLTRQELMNVENFLYLWLRRNDSEWIEENLPSPQRTVRIGKIVDWQKIDLHLTLELNRS